MERVHVDEREVCLIQVKGAKLPRARLRTARGSMRCAGVRGFPLSKKENVNVCVEFSSLRQPQPCCWSPSLPMTRSPDAAAECALEASTAAALSQFEDPGAALSLLVDIGVARSLCAAGATAIAATVSVRRQWARLQSAQLRRGPTTAAAVATTPTATGFARTTERRDAPGLWVLEADDEVIGMACCDNWRGSK
jgi:hypothetical protein